MVESWEKFKQRKKKEFGRLEIPISRFDEITQTIKEILPAKENTYRIHKCIIPSCVDKVVLLNLTKQQANEELERLIRIENARRQKQAETNKEPFYYDYRIVNTDATEKEKSPYYNDCKIMIEH